jgi:hypothetical protein
MLLGGLGGGGLRPPPNPYPPPQYQPHRRRKQRGGIVVNMEDFYNSAEYRKIRRQELGLQSGGFF